MNMKKLFIILSILSLVACEVRTKGPIAKQTQSEKAQEAANSISFTSNAEIENIKSRLELTSDPGLTGFILLMNEAGQPIMYTGVVGKVTSGGKRLTPPIKEWRIKSEGSSIYEGALGAAPSDEGTWGSSSPYIFFWTTSGQYIQWNGKYLYSDQPFRTKIEPLVIAIK